MQVIWGRLSYFAREKTMCDIRLLCRFFIACAVRSFGGIVGASVAIALYFFIVLIYWLCRESKASLESVGIGITGGAGFLLGVVFTHRCFPLSETNRTTTAPTAPASLPGQRTATNQYSNDGGEEDGSRPLIR